MDLIDKVSAFPAMLESIFAGAISGSAGVSLFAARRGPKRPRFWALDLEALG